MKQFTRMQQLALDMYEAIHTHAAIQHACSSTTHAVINMHAEILHPCRLNMHHACSNIIDSSDLGAANNSVYHTTANPFQCFHAQNV